MREKKTLLQNVELSQGKNVQVKASTSRIFLTMKQSEDNLRPLQFSRCYESITKARKKFLRPSTAVNSCEKNRLNDPSQPNSVFNEINLGYFANLPRDLTQKINGLQNHARVSLRRVNSDITTRNNKSPARHPYEENYEKSCLLENTLQVTNVPLKIP